MSIPADGVMGITSCHQIWGLALHEQAPVPIGDRTEKSYACGTRRGADL